MKKTMEKKPRLFIFHWVYPYRYLIILCTLGLTAAGVAFNMKYPPAPRLKALIKLPDYLMIKRFLTTKYSDAPKELQHPLLNMYEMDEEAIALIRFNFGAATPYRNKVIAIPSFAANFIEVTIKFADIRYSEKALEDVVKLLEKQLGDPESYRKIANDIVHNINTDLKGLSHEEKLVQDSINMWASSPDLVLQAIALKSEKNQLKVDRLRLQSITSKNITSKIEIIWKKTVPPDHVKRIVFVIVCFFCGLGGGFFLSNLILLYKDWKSQGYHLIN